MLFTLSHFLNSLFLHSVLPTSFFFFVLPLSSFLPFFHPSFLSLSQTIRLPIITPSFSISLISFLLFIVFSLPFFPDFIFFHTHTQLNHFLVQERNGLHACEEGKRQRDKYATEYLENTSDEKREKDMWRTRKG